MSADDTSVVLVRSWDTEEIVALYRAGGWWKDETILPRSPGLSAAVLPSWSRPIQKPAVPSGWGVRSGRGVGCVYPGSLRISRVPGGGRLGTAMVSLLVNLCRGAGISWIALVAEPDSEQFYHSLGFVRMEGHIPLIYRGDA